MLLRVPDRFPDPKECHGLGDVVHSEQGRATGRRPGRRCEALWKSLIRRCPCDGSQKTLATRADQNGSPHRAEFVELSQEAMFSKPTAVEKSPLAVLLSPTAVELSPEAVFESPTAVDVRPVASEL